MTKQLKICILGGTGFVGHRITAELAELGHRVTILSRRRQRHRDVLVWPTVGLREGDVYDPDFLAAQFRGMDAVINLVGILNERGHRGRGFERAHVGLAETIAAAIQATGMPRLLQMGALNAHEEAPSHYLRTKARAEEIVHKIPDCNVTSFRPSVIFGAGDSFTNRFAALLQAIPLAFPLAKPGARFQPIHVDDVALCFVNAITHHASFGLRYNLGGPRIHTLFEIVELINHLTGADKRIIPLGDFMARLQASVMEWVPGKPFSLDNLRSLEVDSICHTPCPLPFGIEPRSLENVAPLYLGPEEEDPLNRIRNAPPAMPINGA